MSSLIMGSIVLGLQMGAILVKSEQIGISAFWAARASSVNKDAERAAARAFGSEPLAHEIILEAGNGEATLTYRVVPAVFPLLARILGKGPRSVIEITGTETLLPEPGGLDGDN